MGHDLGADASFIKSSHTPVRAGSHAPARAGGRGGYTHEVNMGGEVPRQEYLEEDLGADLSKS